MSSAFVPEPGSVLAGKYRVEKVLGHGGMGIVVAARHVQLEQRVAVKLMLPEVTSSGEAVARFLREARAAARIESDHVVRVFDVGTLESGAPYMAMEYLEGTDLSALLQARGALPPEQAASYLLEACEAIAEAHAVGVIHRDIKPSNLFLARKRDGTALVKVLDFGISKLAPGTAGSEAAFTRTAALIGSPLYMSPEQMASSRDVDGRTDVWSLGVVLYEALTGRVPFMAETMPQICVAVMNHDAPPPSSHAPNLPPGLNEVVLRCLAKRPSDRYASVADLGRALAPFAAGGRSTLGSISLPGDAKGTSPVEAQSAAKSPPQATHAAWGKTRPPGESRRGALLAIGVALAGGLAALGWLLLRSPVDVTPEPTATASIAAIASEAPPATVASPAPPVVPEPSVPLAVSASAPSASTASTALPTRRTSTVRPSTPKAPAPPPPSPKAQPPSAKTTPPAPSPAPSPTDLGKPGTRSRL